MYPSGEFFEGLKFPAGANLYLGKGLVTSNKIKPQVSNLTHALYFSNSWYPPGHGDIYGSFYNSGLVQKFIDDGKEFIFVSNIDNLGATVDVNIL